MSVASQLRQRVHELKRQKQEEEAQEALRKEEAATEFQSRIFERARQVYDACIVTAQTAAEQHALKASHKLDHGRFSQLDFAPDLNAWSMAVIALRENGLGADLIMDPRYEPADELAGESTAYVPTIKLSWEK